jgi:nucleotide-binding universal stress UspA family protein
VLRQVGQRGREAESSCSQQSDLDKQLRAAADRVPDDLSLTTRLLDGDPARASCCPPREGQHDLIVMGSRARGRMTAALLGSVSNRVMHEADVRVLVVHPPRSDGPDLAA